jgi:hypothetical protein
VGGETRSSCGHLGRQVIIGEYRLHVARAPSMDARLSSRALAHRRQWLSSLASSDVPRALGCAVIMIRSFQLCRLCAIINMPLPMMLDDRGRNVPSQSMQRSNSPPQAMVSVGTRTLPAPVPCWPRPQESPEPLHRSFTCLCTRSPPPLRRTCCPVRLMTRCRRSGKGQTRHSRDCRRARARSARPYC